MIMLCPFCRIAQSNDPNALILWENDFVFCFLPLEMEVYGHVSFHPIGAFILAGKEHDYEFDDIVHHIIDFAMKTRRRISRTGIMIL